MALNGRAGGITDFGIALALNTAISFSALSFCKSTDQKPFLTEDAITCGVNGWSSFIWLWCNARTVAIGKVRFHHMPHDETKVAVRLRLPQDSARSCGTIDSKQQPQQNYLCCLSTQIVSFSRHLCSMRDARADKSMPKERFLEKVTRKIRIYLHWT